MAARLRASALLASAALAGCAALSGCALHAPDRKDAPLRPGEVVSVEQARAKLTVGTSTKAEVQATLGKATVVGFQSGYEVWVYRERLPETTPRSPAGAQRAELVLLLSPDGTLAGARVRRAG